MLKCLTSCMPSKFLPIFKERVVLTTLIFPYTILQVSRMNSTFSIICQSMSNKDLHLWKGTCSCTSMQIRKPLFLNTSYGIATTSTKNYSLLLDQANMLVYANNNAE